MRPGDGSTTRDCCYGLKNIAPKWGDRGNSRPAHFECPTHKMYIDDVVRANMLAAATSAPVAGGCSVLRRGVARAS
jgi:hypothetical protein